MDIDRLFITSFERWKSGIKWYITLSVISIIVFFVFFYPLSLLGLPEAGAVLGATFFWITLVCGYEGKSKFAENLKQKSIDVGVSALLTAMPMILLTLTSLITMLTVANVILSAGIFMVGVALTSTLMPSSFIALKKGWNKGIEESIKLGKNNFGSLFLLFVFFLSTFAFLMYFGYVAAVIIVFFLIYIFAGVYYELVRRRMATRDSGLSPKKR